MESCNDVKPVQSAESGIQHRFKTQISPKLSIIDIYQ